MYHLDLLSLNDTYLSHVRWCCIIKTAQFRFDTFLNFRLFSLLDRAENTRDTFSNSSVLAPKQLFSCFNPFELSDLFADPFESNLFRRPRPVLQNPCPSRAVQLAVQSAVLSSAYIRLLILMTSRNVAEGNNQNKGTAR